MSSCYRCLSSPYQGSQPWYWAPTGDPDKNALTWDNSLWGPLDAPTPVGDSVGAVTDTITTSVVQVLTWDEPENGVWKGWTYSQTKNRYYFDDIGNESLTDLWSEAFLRQAE